MEFALIILAGQSAQEIGKLTDRSLVKAQGFQGINQQLLAYFSVTLTDVMAFR